ncbi:hypothetical protein D3C71_336770 [compost metagenome]
MRLTDGDILTTFRLPVLGKGGVEILVEFACWIVGHVQKLARGKGRRYASCSERHAERKHCQPLSNPIGEVQHRVSPVILVP